MLDSIFIGTSGMTGYEKGLRVIGNNLSNVNTPGFRGSQLQFADLVYQNTGGGAEGLPGAQSGVQLGTGLATLSTMINFKPGDTQTTGNDLDLAISGDGYFVLRKDGHEYYTRAGQFQFDKDGFLVSKTNNQRVAGFDDKGVLSDISIDGLHINAAKATTSVKFNGNLLSTATTDFVLNSVKVIDPAGGEHLVKLTFKNQNTTTPGKWNVEVADSTSGTVIGTGSIQFTNGAPTAGSSSFSINYSPSGAPAFSFKLDFSDQVTSVATGTDSTIAVLSQDGYGVGNLTGATFDGDGVLQLTYSNGQTAKGSRLALAQFLDTSSVQLLGGNELVTPNAGDVRVGKANEQSLGSIQSGVVEGSNVDMAQEFSNLIVMQRGYQASSHVVSTANDMIQELFDMKGHR